MKAQGEENLLVIPASGAILPPRASWYLELIPLWIDPVESPWRSGVHYGFCLHINFLVLGDNQSGGGGQPGRKENFFFF
jgi:hypothetical protein